jgi:hypothetical protein
MRAEILEIDPNSTTKEDDHFPLKVHIRRLSPEQSTKNDSVNHSE